MGIKPAAPGTYVVFLVPQTRRLSLSVLYQRFLFPAEPDFASWMKIYTKADFLPQGDLRARIY